MIICISGLTSAGKTTFANYLINEFDKLGYKTKHYTSDWLARKIFPDKYEDLQKDDYTPEELTIIYNGLFMLFEEVLKANPNTIIITDGMYRKASQRLMLQIIAEKLNTKFQLIKINTTPEIAKKRVMKRFKETGIGGWVEPSEYEEPSKNETIFVENNGDESNLKQIAEEIISKFVF